MKIIFLVNLTTTQVETLFGELEYLELQLKALGIVDADGAMTYRADEEADNA